HKSPYTLISLCNLCVLCGSVVCLARNSSTTETQRTQRLHRELSEVERERRRRANMKARGKRERSGARRPWLECLSGYAALLRRFDFVSHVFDVRLGFVFRTNLLVVLKNPGLLCFVLSIQLTAF